MAVLRGALDLTAERGLRDVFAALPEPVAILDLSAVEILSASCLGLIVEDAAARGARGYALALVAADGLALRVVRLSGAHTCIPTFPSLSDAVREMGERELGRQATDHGVGEPRRAPTPVTDRSPSSVRDSGPGQRIPTDRRTSRAPSVSPRLCAGSPIVDGCPAVLLDTAAASRVRRSRAGTGVSAECAERGPGCTGT
ncbi:anti-anti-sigma regulatory factor [Actinokineospora spheciospongiae]|nr:anti-anti-sigma regulatory factor [Actinokineospora spheciospongiae]